MKTNTCRKENPKKGGTKPTNEYGLITENNGLKNKRIEYMTSNSNTMLIHLDTIVLKNSKLLRSELKLDYML